MRFFDKLISVGRNHLYLRNLGIGHFLHADRDPKLVGLPASRAFPFARPSPVAVETTLIALAPGHTWFPYLGAATVIAQR
jgi:hypothetical protein